MTVTAGPAVGSDTDLEARFIAEVLPLTEVLSREARRLTGNHADAEDLMQETLLHAYTGFRTYAQGTNVRAWLFRIQRNRWINAYRWRERRPAEVLSDDITDRDLAGYGAHLSNGLRSVEVEVLESLPDDAVRGALDRLSEGFRRVLFHVDVEGYTYAETAALMDIPVGTVMSRSARARAQLRRALTGTAGVAAEVA